MINNGKIRKQILRLLEYIFITLKFYDIINGIIGVAPAAPTYFLVF